MLDADLKRYIRNIWRRYRIKHERYCELLSVQNYRCALCGRTAKEADERKNRLEVDHCHVTGRIRGLLCNLCNKKLGILEKNLEFFTKANEYLKNASSK